MTASSPVPSRASVIVCGLARDCAGALGETIAALRRATEGFREVRFLVVESDSKDETPARLAAAGVETIRLGNLRREMPRRTERLAFCRNRVVEEVRSRHLDVDYVILADLDGPNRRVSRDALESAWSSEAPWDVITANQDGPYYDVWALRHPVWCPDDCWQAYRRLSPVFGDQAARRLTVQARQMRLPPQSGLIEVDSAFGGLAIYRRQAFVSGRYLGIDENDSEVCEHVTFHSDLRSAGFRIFINSRLLNETQVEHIGTASAFGRVRRKMRQVLSDL